MNTVSNAVIRGETNGRLGPGGARVWLFIGFVMGFAAIIAACWILFADFVTKSTGWYYVLLRKKYYISYISCIIHNILVKI